MGQLFSSSSPPSSGANPSSSSSSSPSSSAKHPSSSTNASSSSSSSSSPAKAHHHPNLNSRLSASNVAALTPPHHPLHGALKGQSPTLTGRLHLAGLHLRIPPRDVFALLTEAVGSPSYTDLAAVATGSASAAPSTATTTTTATSTATATTTTTTTTAETEEEEEEREEEEGQKKEGETSSETPTKKKTMTTATTPDKNSNDEGGGSGDSFREGSPRAAFVAKPLRILDLSFNELSQLSFAADSLPLPSLEELILSGNAFGSHAEDLVAGSSSAAASAAASVNPKRSLTKRMLSIGSKKAKGNGSGSSSGNSSGKLSYSTLSQEQANAANFAAALGGLHSLAVLDLSDNHLAELLDLAGVSATLSILNLCANDISKLELARLQPLQHLRTLDLRRNLLTELPAGLFAALPSLSQLYLNGNQLSQLDTSPPALSSDDDASDASSLATLSANDNAIEKLSDHFFHNFKSLLTLMLKHNHLRTLPDFDESSSSLQKAYLNYNSLEHLPDNCEHLSSLTLLELSYNSLTTLPQSLKQITNLTTLCLGRNRISHLPNDIFEGMAGCLEFLDLAGNRLDRLPESLALCERLKYINLNDNLLGTAASTAANSDEGNDANGKNEEGKSKENDDEDEEIAKENGEKEEEKTEGKKNEEVDELSPLWSLKALEELHLCHNHLRKVSSGLAQLTSLVVLNLCWNEIANDGLPESLDTLANMVAEPYPGCAPAIYLSHNRLTKFPQQFLSFQGLRQLWLDDNPMEGLGAWPDLSPFSKLQILSVPYSDDLAELPTEKLEPITDLLRVYFNAPLNWMSSEQPRMPPATAVKKSIFLEETDILESEHCPAFLKASVLGASDLASSSSSACAVSNVTVEATQITNFAVAHKLEDTLLVRGFVYGQHHIDVLGIFDGHGGSAVSSVALERFFPILMDKMRNVPAGLELDKIEWEILLQDVFTALNVEVFDHLTEINKAHSLVGSTALVVLVFPDFLVCGGIGDSRAVAVRIGKAALVETVALSVDHKPTLPSEDRRLRSHGAIVVEEKSSGTCRIYVGGNAQGLSVSRALGDFPMKPAVTAEAEFSRHSLSGISHIVLACDGLWDVVTNDEVGQWVAEYDEDSSKRSSSKRGSLANLLRNMAVHRESFDDISVIVAKPRRQPE